jgi:folylpolyglutamate synthase
MLSHHRLTHSLPHKTGLFTSPHLLSVRERIRINSHPIPASMFTHYFFALWDLLSSIDSKPKPGYFRFLTLLSFHVFLNEGVECAIYEVGLGGEFDGTNIIERPAVTGITSLGIDHVFTLGETIEEIAWHKAGIMKCGIPAFTVMQKENAMSIIKQRAEERGVDNLGVVGIDERLKGVKIVPDAQFQRGNASLAVALTETVLKKLDANYVISKDVIPRELKDGIENVVFRGRFEKIQKDNIAWYLDGAHTADSIKVAIQWFKDEVDDGKSLSKSSDTSTRDSTRVLLFNQQGDREAVELLEGLYKDSKDRHPLDFDQVIFCPTRRKSSQTPKKGNFEFLLCYSSRLLLYRFR